MQHYDLKGWGAQIMPIIMLIMHRKMIAQGLMNRLRESPDINLVYEPNYHNTKSAICNCNANVALIEVVESGQYDIDYCLQLCKVLREHCPKCKLLLMCPEENEESIKQVVNAKGQNQIDDFVFYDVTIDYLVSKLRTI